MIYTVSDLHGCKPELLTRLLDKAGFSDSDTLYIIGDVIDRGEHGVEILKWAMNTPNVRFMQGNHERMMLNCEFLFTTIDTEAQIDAITNEQISDYMLWVYNGGQSTIDALKNEYKNSPSGLRAIFDFVRKAPVCNLVSAGSRDFLLVHAGLPDFSPEKPLSEYKPYDLVWHRPKITDRYFDSIFTVLGHTPVGFYGRKDSRILFTETWADIDVGAAYGASPALLRLDDMQDFYL